MSARLQQQHRINKWSTIRISYLLAGDISTRTFDPDTNEFNVQEGFSICEPGQLIILDDNNGLISGTEINRLKHIQAN